MDPVAAFTVRFSPFWSRKLSGHSSIGPLTDPIPPDLGMLHEEPAMGLQVRLGMLLVQALSHSVPTMSTQQVPGPRPRTTKTVLALRETMVPKMNPETTACLWDLEENSAHPCTPMYTEA